MWSNAERTPTRFPSREFRSIVSSVTFRRPSTCSKKSYSTYTHQLPVIDHDFMARLFDIFRVRGPLRFLHLARSAFLFSCMFCSKSFHIRSFIVQLLHFVSLTDIYVTDIWSFDRCKIHLQLAYYIFLYLSSIYDWHVKSKEFFANTNENHT